MGQLELEIGFVYFILTGKADKYETLNKIQYFHLLVTL
jgi:hypothetical protein